LADFVRYGSSQFPQNRNPRGMGNLLLQLGHLLGPHAITHFWN
jgi:hypothetical protein